jgi:alcohol dehydrogenase
VAGPEVYVQTQPADRATKTVAAIRNLTGELKKLSGLPVRLSEAGVTEDKLESIAKATLNDGAVAFSPVEVSFEEALGVLKAAY